MGNIQANSLHLGNTTSNNVTISTRSEPLSGHRVVQELGIVVSNSTGFNQAGGGGKELLAYRQSLELLGKKCAELGGNAVLGTHVEIKQFGDSGALMVVNCSGTACIVA